MCSNSRIIDRIFDSTTALDRNQPLIQLSEPIKDICGVCVMSVTVPFTYDVVSSRNNKFRVVTASDDKVVELPRLTATDAGFTVALQAALTQQNLLFTITAIMSETTGRLLFYSGSGQPFTLDFTVDDSAYELMGFAKAVYQSAALTTGGPQGIQSPFIADLNGGNLLYVHERTLGASMNGALSDESTRSGVIADVRIPEYTRARQQITYDNPSPMPYTMQLATFNRAEFYLTFANEPERALDLNGASFQIKIRFWVQDGEVSQDDPKGMGDWGMSTRGTGHGVLMRNPKRTKNGGCF